MSDRSDIVELCIRYMEKDFSIAQYIPDRIKASAEILSYQKSKGKLSFVKKYYDSRIKCFGIEIKVLYGQLKSEHYRVLNHYTHEGFNEFYDFLDGDLTDAEIREYDFKGIDLRKYNINGAVINSDVLDRYGLYDDSYFSFIRQRRENSENEYTMKNEIVIEDDFSYPRFIDEAYEGYDCAHIPFFYISDIHLTHRVCNRFNDKATKEEIHSYIKECARNMVKSIGSKPSNSFLLIAGDTSSIWEFSTIFYNELVRLWNPGRIIVILGNHELWDPWFDMEENIKEYRNFFNKLGIIFLQNDLLYINEMEMQELLKNPCKVIRENKILNISEKEIRNLVQHSPIVILGGIGFSGLNKEFNASNLRYGKSFDELSREEALQKDIQETNRFNNIYMKLLKAIPRNTVLVLTHTKKENWNMEEYNPYWIYLNGHNHRNYCEVSDRCKIYADNQIGYKSQYIGLKYFLCNNEYDEFVYYQDGIHAIKRQQYIDFNRGKGVQMEFNREDGTIYMIKRKKTYMFLLHKIYSGPRKRLYLMEGGKLSLPPRRDLKDLSYYYDNLDKYAESVKRLLNRYTEKQKQLSKFIKNIGGSGKIHGCIIDVEKPKECDGFSYCHLYVNPIDGKVTPYFAWDVTSRIVYKDFKTLLQKQSRCELMASNYLRLEREGKEKFPSIQYSEQLAEWEGDECIYDEGSYLYKISRIIKNLQYCTEKNIVRLWNEELLDNDFINRIISANQIEDINEDKRIIDIDDV